MSEEQPEAVSTGEPPAPWPESRRELPFRLRVHLASTQDAFDAAIDHVRKLATRSGCSEDKRDDVEIALREALTNALDHGNGWLSRRRVFLRCYAGPASGIVIVIRDEGNGFHPDNVPDPRNAERRELTHGRGLLIMRTLMDRVEYRRGGREVVLYCCG